MSKHPVAALQFDVASRDPEANLAELQRGLEEAAARGVALVVLPEMWPTSFPDARTPRALEAAGGPRPEGVPFHAALPDPVGDTERALQRLRALSREHGVTVCGSAYGRLPGAARPANRFHLVEDGIDVLTSDKMHLFSPTAEGESFSAGDAPPGSVELSALGGARASGVICYDLRFDEVVRRATEDAEVLCVPVQWPEPRGAHFRALCIGRAVEHQCIVIGANRTGRHVVGRRELELRFPGNSVIVSPAGEVLAEGRGEAGLVIADVDLDEVRALRRMVPVRRDRRPELYGRWEADGV
jgi:predicted amidohydrolase